MSPTRVDSEFVQQARLILNDNNSDRLSNRPEDLAFYGKDWSGILESKPSWVAFPGSTSQVAALLRLCSQYRVAVVPSGGRTGLSGGACAAQGELVLSLERMKRLGEVDVGTRTVRVQAGAVTQAVHEHCAPWGLTWPVDFASKGSSQVGGNISTNAGGIRVLRYGNTRAWVLSIQLVTMAGEVLELNGELEKNNTGYDLRHLVIGAEGTLGVVTEATLKLAPLPSLRELYFFAVGSMTEVVRLFRDARHSGLALSAFECLSAACYRESLRFLKERPPISDRGADGFYVLVEVESESSAWLERLFEKGYVQDGVQAQNEKEAQTLWKIREAVAEAVMSAAGNSLVPWVHQQDVSVPVASLPTFAEKIEALYRRDYPELEVFIFGHIGDGNLHVFLRQPQAVQLSRVKELGVEGAKTEFLNLCYASDHSSGGLFETIQEFRGSVSAEHGIGVLKQRALPFSRDPIQIELLRGIKRVFDPHGLLNPGKLIPT